METKNTRKITLPIAIIISAIILGAAFFAVQVNKQESIERQQRIELQEKRAIEGEKAKQADEKAKQEQELAQKEYIAKRKSDCLNIYKTEDDKWNNVRGWRYSVDDDQCLIRYKDPSPKTDLKCDESYPTGAIYGFTLLQRNLLCKEGEFENSF